MQKLPAKELFITLFLWGILFHLTGKTLPLNDFLQQKLEEANLVGMQVALVKNGELLYTGSFGQLHLTYATPVNAQSLFMTATCAQPFTIAAALKVMEQRHISMDDTVDRHLPFALINPAFPTIPISLRMLMGHTSGIKDNWEVLDALYTLPEGGDSPLKLGTFLQHYIQPGGDFFDAAENFEGFAPGNGYGYSNINYALLALWVEQVSGKPFAEYVKDEFFGPLNLPDAYYFWEEVPHANLASPHQSVVENGTLQQTPLPHYGYPDYPNGQLRLSATTYARFLQALLSDTSAVLSKASTQTLFTPLYPTLAPENATAWHVKKQKHSYSLTGNDAGVTNFVWINRKTKSAIVVFCNAETYSFTSEVLFYDELVERLKKEVR